MAVIKDFRFDAESNVVTIKAGFEGSPLEYTLAGKFVSFSSDLTQVFESLACNANSFSSTNMYFDGNSLLPLPDRPSEIHVWNWNALVWEANSSDMVGYVIAKLALKLAEVDSAAERARLRYITGGAGQSATYVLKQTQAREWQSQGFEGNPPSFIAAESEALNNDPVQTALTIIQMADYWGNVKGPEIEATRLKWKARLTAASTLSELSGLVAEAIAALDIL